MTLCHIDTSPILVNLLDDQEKAWLNAYNERVYNELSPFLSEETAKWLREKTLAI
jgi:Xaa-Pro aminopeptidase